MRCGPLWAAGDDYKGGAPTDGSGGAASVARCFSLKEQVVVVVAFFCPSLLGERTGSLLLSAPVEWRRRQISVNGTSTSSEAERALGGDGRVGRSERRGTSRPAVGLCRSRFLLKRTSAVLPLFFICGRLFFFF